MNKAITELIEANNAARYPLTLAQTKAMLSLAAAVKNADALAEALENMLYEFKHDDHNLAYPRCNCQSHQNYAAARAALAAYRGAK